MLGYRLLGLCSLMVLIFMTTKAQEATGVFTGPFTQRLHHTTQASDFTKPLWNINVQSFPNEAEEGFRHLATLKAKQSQQKLEWIKNHPSVVAPKKKRGLDPSIGINFKGNALNSFTPNDNSIAVSDSGIVISVINEGIAYYDTAGNTLLAQISWTDFVNDPTLTEAKYDPRVIYDPKHDRFIVVLLHGYSSTTSKVLVSFSKTNNPLDGWNLYTLSGNPYNDTTWTDYPTIGINDDELFVNGNRWGNGPNYDWKETYIYQIGLSEGYAALPLTFGLWHQISAPDGNDCITLYPASDGMGCGLSQKMYFVEMLPDSGSHVYLFTLHGSLSSVTQTLTASQYNIPNYVVCANAYEKDINSGVVDSLSTGAAWIANAFSLGSVIHFCFSADISGGWCGVHYGRIYLDSNKAVVNAYGMAGTDVCYPAIAAFGYDSTDHSAVMAFEHADTTTLPETQVIALDKNGNWSNAQVVKSGDTSVNILFLPDIPYPMPERWGDYTGICRKYNSTIPQAWMAAGYGANALRKNSYGTWIAQITSNESQPNEVHEQAYDHAGGVYPNPTNDLFTLWFHNDSYGRVSIDLYDMQGRKVKNLFADDLEESENHLSFNQLMLVPGNYVLKITNNGKEIQTHTLSIIGR